MIKNEKGSVELIVIGILVIALLGAVGYIAWRQLSVKSDDTAKNTTSQEKSTNETQKPDETKLNSNEGYLVVKEWGVRFKIPSSLKDIGIVYTVDNEKNFSITTARVKEILDSCKYEDTSGTGVMASTAVVRSTDKSSVTRSTDGHGPVLLKDDKVGGYYYGRSGDWLPLTTCTTNQLDLQKSDADSLANMLQTIEVVAS